MSRVDQAVSRPARRSRRVFAATWAQRRARRSADTLYDADNLPRTHVAFRPRSCPESAPSPPSTLPVAAEGDDVGGAGPHRLRASRPKDREPLPNWRRCSPSTRPNAPPKRGSHPELRASTCAASSTDAGSPPSDPLVTRTSSRNLGRVLIPTGKFACRTGCPAPRLRIWARHSELSCSVMSHGHRSSYLRCRIHAAGLFWPQRHIALTDGNFTVPANRRALEFHVCSSTIGQRRTRACWIAGKPMLDFW